MKEHDTFESVLQLTGLHTAGPAVPDRGMHHGFFNAGGLGMEAG